VTDKTIDAVQGFVYVASQAKLFAAMSCTEEAEAKQLVTVADGGAATEVGEFTIPLEGTESEVLDVQTLFVADGACS
jgi:hypothetical protein